MLDGFINAITEFFLKILYFPSLVVLIIAILPIVEARLAIPIGINYGLSHFNSWWLSFVGSSAIVPLLLLILIPFIKWLSKTKLFRKAGTYLFEKFDSKSKSLKSEDGKSKSDFKKMLGVFIFVAIPMPLTGVWTGCAVASIIGLKYWKALIAIIGGNLVASVIITLLTFFLKPYVNMIILIIGIIAIVTVIALIVKIIISKPKKPMVSEELVDDNKVIDDKKDNDNN